MLNTGGNRASYSVLLLAMAFTVFCTMTAVTMLGPLLVDMSRGLNTSLPVTAQLVTASAVAWAVTALVSGPFSDAYGRKPVLMLGAVMVVAGSVGTALAPSFAIAVGFRLLAGVGGGMIPPTCIAIVGDTFPARRRAMSVATITMQPGLSGVIGTPLAAVLGDYAGWRSPFMVIGVAVALAALALFTLLPHRQPQASGLHLRERLGHVAALPLTWYMAGANLVVRIAFGVITTFFPAFLLLTYGLRTAQVALPVSMVALGATLGPLVAGRIGSSRPPL
ncbi:MAG: MFS transporter, partial [Chloroflexota bacterium]